jgi:DNA-directed RNA polymerase alpha subunit
LSIFVGSKHEPQGQAGQAALEADEAEVSEELKEILGRPISSLELSTKTANLLKKAKVKTVKNLTALTFETLNSITQNNKTIEKSLEEIKDKLAEIGLSFEGGKK